MGVRSPDNGQWLGDRKDDSTRERGPVANRSQTLSVSIAAGLDRARNWRKRSSALSSRYKRGERGRREHGEQPNDRGIQHWGLARPVTECRLMWLVPIRGRVARHMVEAGP